ncbi:MAG: Organic solvent tolerance protein OstA [Cyclobacteriaceae bacterium]|nr:Organic solvent tolerance protein OstA [Cyclobacteriaceae bacterium]
MSKRLLLALCIPLLLTGLTAHAQKRVKIQNADKLKGGSANGERFERLLGNVVLTQNKTTIYCDSAYFYKSKNTVEAFGRVRITEGDSVTITARRLDYDGNEKKAKLRNNVVFTKLAMATLYTDHLDYERPANKAYYYNGGRLVDSINVLTSQRGYYNVNSNLASFKKNVVVVNPDYTMMSDSLQYNSRTKIILFVAKTTVVNKDSSTFVYEGGQYDTKTKRSDLQQGAGESPDYAIQGLQYDLDAVRSIYKIRGNVVMSSKKENLIIHGQASDYYKLRGITKIYNNAFIAKVTDDQDTLYMTADTLVSIESNDPAKKRILAYHNVKIFKKNLQGKADSLEYRASDSTLFFYTNPVLWTEGNQMTADSIRMLIKRNTIDKIVMVGNSFVISRDTLLNFNQIKGRRMTAEFNGKQINRVFVEGNGESIYFALDDKTLALIGMNKIICSNIIIRFKEGRVNNLTFLVKPEANFVPPHEFITEEKTLKGFLWKEDEKPSKTDVVKKPDQEQPLPQSARKRL